MYFDLIIFLFALVLLAVVKMMPIFSNRHPNFFIFVAGFLFTFVGLLLNDVVGGASFILIVQNFLFDREPYFLSFLGGIFLLLVLSIGL
jgi:hypothetical protein